MEHFHPHQSGSKLPHSKERSGVRRGIRGH